MLLIVCVCVWRTEWSAEQWKHRFGSNRPGATLNRTEHNHRLQPWQRTSPWLGWDSPEESFLRFMCAVRLVENNNNLAPSDTLQTQPDVTSLNRRAEVCSCGGDGFVQHLSLCHSAWEKHSVFPAGENIAQVCVCVCGLPCVHLPSSLPWWHCRSKALPWVNTVRGINPASTLSYLNRSAVIKVLSLRRTSPWCEQICWRHIVWREV